MCIVCSDVFVGVGSSQQVDRRCWERALQVLSETYSHSRYSPAAQEVLWLW
jgi:hypothetical protein